MADKVLGRAILGKEVLGRRHLRTMEYPVPEWDGIVLLRRLTERELVELQETAQRVNRDVKTEGVNFQELSRFRRSLVYACWVDEQGDQVLDDINDIDALANEDFAIIDAIAEAAGEHNGMDRNAIASAEKNLETTQNGASGSS